MRRANDYKFAKKWLSYAKREPLFLMGYGQGKRG